MEKQYVYDMVLVKALERTLGRAISRAEVESDFGIEIPVKDGKFEVIHIPTLLFPTELAGSTRIQDRQFEHETLYPIFHRYSPPIEELASHERQFMYEGSDVQEAI